MSSATYLSTPALISRITEIQAFLFELISELKFEPTKKAARIRRENCLVTLPMVEGEEQKGNQLPLVISIIDHSDSNSEQNKKDIL